MYTVPHSAPVTAFSASPQTQNSMPAEAGVASTTRPALPPTAPRVLVAEAVLQQCSEIAELDKSAEQLIT